MALNDPDPTPLRIADVERETGLSKDVLRIWERRYGFPVPVRDAQGRRCYSAEQVRRLHLLRALVDRGGRPAELMRESDAVLAGRLQALGAAAPVPPVASVPHLDEALRHLAADRPEALEALFQRHVLEFGLRRFLLDVAVPLATGVGEAWESGRLAIHQEHVFSDCLLRFLAEATRRWRAASPDAVPRSPRMLLATLPGEQHLIGLAMVETWSTLDGCACRSLGGGLPVAEIAAAARAQRADIVALSFSACFDPARGQAQLAMLGDLLDKGCQLWIGGGRTADWAPGSARVQCFRNLADLGPAITAWRAARGAG
ncbi:MerR family transcriptional regulator [Sphingomonas elodea]|uniref:MerR family transcriptional regulator n=1 Tax=Sphingomonas elodea TaxID=179878 RepID=UPI000263070A|nr:MerR family transcriptional regulator [Sphingomonas elodea]